MANLEARDFKSSNNLQKLQILELEENLKATGLHKNSKIFLHQTPVYDIVKRLVQNKDSL